MSPLFTMIFITIPPKNNCHWQSLSMCAVYDALLPIFDGIFVPRHRLCYLSKQFYVFVKVITCICQRSCSCRSDQTAEEHIIVPRHRLCDHIGFHGHIRRSPGRKAYFIFRNSGSHTFLAYLFLQSQIIDICRHIDIYQGHHELSPE